MLMKDVLMCTFSHWYPRFRPVTIESDIIFLDPEVKNYLLADGILLPKSCFDDEEDDDDANRQHFDDEDSVNDRRRDSQTDEDDDDGDDGDDLPQASTPHLPEFVELEQSIRRSIEKYEYVFPKLNWSSCEDARWIQTLGTKCSTLSEVFLLLKSSDKVVHDLTEPFKFCSDFVAAESVPEIRHELVLRRWQNINPSMEFRCFVAANHLFAVCQRDVRTYYEHIEPQKSSIIADIRHFFHQHIRDRFELQSYVLDLHRPAPGTIILIDINPFGEFTDSLLFDWDDLRARAQAEPQADDHQQEQVDFRFIETPIGVQRQRFELNALPVDVFNGNLDPNVFQSDLINGQRH